ncbi:MAG: hypothetical protein P8K81_03900, partial [Flavobacteriales bacterium]|nr:hypothetical protein [Flavobacteriales bacterium]
MMKVRFLGLMLGLLCMGSMNAQLTELIAEEHSVTEYGVIYRFYAQFTGTGQRIVAVFATEAYLQNPPILLVTDDPNGFYQSTYGADFAQNLNLGFFSFFPDLIADSWLTIGADVGENGEVQSVNLNAQLNAFNTGGEFSTDGLVAGGSWFTTTGTPFYADEDGRILMGQLTVGVGYEAMFQCNVQWRDADDVSHETLGLSATGGFSGGGCMDSESCNYDETASEDDGSCLYPSDAYHDCNGNCIDDFDGDGVCDALEVGGCTASIACNFNANATDSDGSCEFPVDEYNCDGDCLIDSDGDGICNAFEIVGCQDVTACNYDVDATDNGSCDYPETGYSCDGNCLIDTDGDGICDSFEVAGCLDSSACNFHDSATEDGGGCVYSSGCEFCSGALDGTGEAMDGDSDNDGVCDLDEIVGCQILSACNYHESATDAGSCVFAYGCDMCSGETDGSGFVVDLDADNDGVCDEEEILGCTNSWACNYLATATEENGSCNYASGCDSCSGASDGTGYVVNGDADNDQIFDVDEVIGCQEPLACNYNSLATDSAACNYPESGYDCSGSCLSDFDGDGVCDPFELNGCMYSDACNYNASATDENGSCVFASSGLDCNGDCLFDVDADGICDELEVVGCQDSAACNYDALAT